MDSDLSQTKWWKFLDTDIQELMQESMVLLTKVGDWDEKFHDYAFVIFPAAKAYEGFLKKLFLDMQFITSEEYEGKNFRIGRALNPSLEDHLRDQESIYDKLVKHSHSKILPDQLWDTWKRCRNLTFHWFPKEKNAITLAEARENFILVVDAIQAACEVCLTSQ